MTDEKIIKTIINNPGLAYFEIADKLKVPRPVFYQQVARMRKAGVSLPARKRGRRPTVDVAGLNALIAAKGERDGGW